MAKNKPEAERPKKPKPQRPVGPWPFSYGLRLAISVWLVWHLFVVFISPLSLQPKPSELARVTAQNAYVTWYSTPLYLNGGYSFFSPDPPMSGRIIRWKVYGDDPEPIAEGEFPNRTNPKYATQWPRLWYHRHMMLVDQASDLPGLQGEQNVRLTLRSFARHLIRKHEGSGAELELVEHISLHPGQAREGVDPTEPQFYRTLDRVTERADQLIEPLLPDPAELSAEPLPPAQRN